MTVRDDPHRALLDWAGLSQEMGQQGHVEPTESSNLVGYFRDCTVASQRSLALRNVFEVSDAQCISVPNDAWLAAIDEGLTTPGKAALNLALANRVSPFEKPLVMGALFVVGRYTPGPGRPRAYCAPLLVGSVSQSTEGTSVTFLLEGDVALNLPLLAELAGVDADNEEEMLARFETVADLTPDAPLPVAEVEAFLEALRVGLDLPLALPTFEDMGELDLADEYALGGPLRLLPTSAIFIGREAGELSVIRELGVIAEAAVEESALQAVLEPEDSDLAADGDAASALPPQNAGSLPEGWHDNIEIIEITDAQRKVIDSARRAPLTVVTGPPGTGKSYTICALVLDHLLAGRRVLVASGTPKAVEVVVSKLEELVGPLVCATSGDRTTQRALAKKIEKITSAQLAPREFPGEQIEAERSRYYQLRAEIAVLEEQVLQTLAREGALAFHLEAVEGLASLVARFDLRRITADPEKLSALRERVAVEPDAAWFRRFRAHRALETLRRQLHAQSDASAEELLAGADSYAHEREVEDLTRALTDAPDLVAGWQALAELRSNLLDVGARVLAMQRQAELASLLADNANRRALRSFMQALRAARHAEKKELLAKVPVEVLLGAFPCWASTDRHVSHILPLRRALFDLAVIDEASQVNLGAATPVLYRALRAVIVGDPHQLRFVSFLSRAAEAAAFARYDIAPARQATHRFSRRSLFDVAEDAVAQHNNHMLDEHFRSQPQIISFSNDEFYSRCMRIMTERPHSQGARSVHVRWVGGHREALVARNQAEIDAAMTVAREAIADAERGGPVKTLGLLSPYRDQTNGLSQAVVAAFTPEQIMRHSIVCGTAHSLQGDERDIVVLSTVIDPNYNSNSLRFLEDPNLFNVAITRAAERLVVVTSVTIADLPSGGQHYLSKFLRHAEALVDPANRADVFRSGFEREVCDALRARARRVVTNYPSCGYEIDLVVTDGTSSVAVECDGHPSHFRPDGSYTTEDLQRHAVLSRAGWVIHRIPLSSWRRDSTRHLDRIDELLAQSESPRGRTPPTLPEPLPLARPTIAAPRGSARKLAPARATPRKRSAKPSGGRVPVSDARCACGGHWVLRNGRYGKFYGCSRFPRCRRTRRFG